MASLHFSSDATDSAPQIGFHKGFSEGGGIQGVWPTEEHPLWDQRSSGIGRIQRGMQARRKGAGLACYFKPLR